MLHDQRAIRVTTKYNACTLAMEANMIVGGCVEGGRRYRRYRMYRRCRWRYISGNGRIEKVDVVYEEAGERYIVVKLRFPSPARSAL